jgi:hypothetical protein
MHDDRQSDMENMTGIDIANTIDLQVDPEALANEPSYLSNFLASLQSLLSAPVPTPTTSTGSLFDSKKEQYVTRRHSISGALPLGPGAAPLPDTSDPDEGYSDNNPLAWSSIYIHPGTLCEERLKIEVAKQNQVVVVQRGGCSFSAKLRNIPAFPPDSLSLQLVIIVSFPHHEQPSVKMDENQGPRQIIKDAHSETHTGAPVVQPLLDESKRTVWVSEESTISVVRVSKLRT